MARGPVTCIEGERERTVTLQLTPSNVLADQCSVASNLLAAPLKTPWCPGVPRDA